MPPELTARHLRVVIKYFEGAERLSVHEWRLALETFDEMGKATVAVGDRRLSFQQVYERYVDRRHADDFIGQLMALEDSTAEADALQQKTALQMLTTLEGEGLYDKGVANSEYLAAYCLYWWTAVARGYGFEVTVFRDLRASGIAYVAHDLRKRAERRSPYDLMVLRQLGDIKSTTKVRQRQQARVTLLPEEE